MRLAPVAGITLSVLLLVAACAGGAGGPSPSGSPGGSPEPSAEPPSTAAGVTVEDLEGRTFLVTAADGHALVEGSEVSLRFEGGGIAVSAGCNQMSGAFALEDGRLVVGPMMATEMACDAPLMDQDTWMSGFLSDAAIALEGDTLTLARDGVTLTATDREVADPDRPLEGTVWALDGLVAGQAVSSMPLGVTGSLAFGDGTVDVRTGCNTGSGTASIADGTITFGAIATTKMACEAAAMEVERLVLRVLRGDVSYRIEANSLELSGAGGGLMLRAEPAGS